MKHSNTNGERLSIGIDLGDRRCHYCVMNEHEEIIVEHSVATTDSAMRRVFSEFPSAHIVIEAGTHSPWISRLLAGCGHDVRVANPRVIGRKYLSKTKKNDKTDARTLAHLGRVSEFFLAPIKHRSRASQVDLSLIRSRDALMKARTQLINHARTIVKGFGLRLPKSTSDAFAKKVESHIPSELKNGLGPILEEIARLTEQIKDYNNKVETLCKEKYPETELLMQIPGVGYLTALAFILTLEDPRRFRTSRRVGSFLGLVPRQHESGDVSPQLRITKCGNEYMRRLLVCSAQYILGYFGTDSDLRRHGERIANRGGKAAKKRAVIAVARKLSVVLHRIWLTAQVYDPLYSETQKKKAS